MAITTFHSPGELLAAVGRCLGTTDWMTVTAEAVSQFSEATGSPVPDDGTVPPLMVLSLTNLFLPELLEVRGVSSGINYGTGQVRFGSVARPGDRLRATAIISAATEVPQGVQTTVEITVEAEDAKDPACVVESLSRWLQ
jgi:acyl dehydratase